MPRSRSATVRPGPAGDRPCACLAAAPAPPGRNAPPPGPPRAPPAPRRPAGRGLPSRWCCGRRCQGAGRPQSGPGRLVTARAHAWLRLALPQAEALLIGPDGAPIEPGDDVLADRGTVLEAVPGTATN